jgi:hypothetical protein
MASENQQLARSPGRVLSIGGYHFYLPENLGCLIYTSDEPAETALAHASPTASINLVFGADGATSVEGPAIWEPSTIYVRMDIRRPAELTDVTQLDYSPIYARLGPEQRWIYLNWLQDVSRPIDIGYVFLLYYGLERQLLLDNFEHAFDEILGLRGYHRQRSFLRYSRIGLLSGCILRRQPYRLNEV